MNFTILDNHQLNILNRFIKRENIFMTGSAGTGKSFVINMIKQLCDTVNLNCQVTALTGCAALLLNCGAKTIHSWSGITLDRSIKTPEKYESIYKNLQKKKDKRENWKSIDVLIVDEVSMMSKNLFTVLDFVAKKFRKSDKPFGGIQVVFSGDFYQLPPVNTGEDKGDTQFCFESDLWKETFPSTCILTKIFRQQNQEFSKILNEIRVGKIKKSTIKTIQARILPYKGDSEIIPTQILSNRKTVDRINQEEHNKLEGQSYIFHRDCMCPSDEIISKEKYNYTFINREKEAYEKTFNFIETLDIKIGDQVMCIKNLSESIVNGSRGVVIRVDKYPVVKFLNGYEMEMTPVEIKHDTIKGLSWKQVPLNYAWALTIHKCQGISLDLCIMDIGNSIFECGQTYVALSRVKNLDGLYLTDFNPYKILVNTKVTKFYNEFAKPRYNCLKTGYSSDNWADMSSYLQNSNLYKNVKLHKSMFTKHLYEYKCLDCQRFYETNSTKEQCKCGKSLCKIVPVCLNEPIDTVIENIHQWISNKKLEKIDKWIEPIYKINETLLQRLKEYRLHKSIELSCAPFIIFSNRILDILASHPIQSTEDLLDIKGIGNVFMTNHSANILEIINNSK